MSDLLETSRELIEQYGLSVSSLPEECPDCGATVPVVENGSTHPYFGASPGCWALYTAMLGREFDNWDAETHRLSVDTYAVQHPGTPSPQAINSVGVHLTALCLTFEKQIPVSQVIRLMGRLSKGRDFEFHLLAPPADPYPMTIVDLVDATAPEAYNARVREWSSSTWEAWSEHHGQVRSWAELAANS